MSIADHPDPGASGTYLAAARVVVIDDQRSVLRLVRDVLELDGHEVYDALNGPIGLGLVSAVGPEVVVLDLMMPGMDGLEVCRRIVADHPGARVLVLTGSADPDAPRHSTEAGASAYLTKPLDPAGLSAVVAALAAQAEAEAA